MAYMNGNTKMQAVWCKNYLVLLSLSVIGIKICLVAALTALLEANFSNIARDLPGFMVNLVVAFDQSITIII